MTDELPFPDVTIRRTRFTGAGAPVRCFNLVTPKAEDWAEANLQPGEFRQLGRGLVVPKSRVAELARRLTAGGLVVRELLGSDLSLAEPRHDHRV